MSLDGLLQDFNTFGLLFESMCVRDLRVYTHAIDGEIFHNHDKNGLEADAVVHLKDGRWGAIEVKMEAVVIITRQTCNIMIEVLISIEVFS